MKQNDNLLWFDPEVFEQAKADGYSEADKYSTSILPGAGIDINQIPEQDLESIRKNKTAYLMLIHNVRERDKLYQQAMSALEKAKKELIELEQKTRERKSAVVILTVAELITSIGVGGLFTEYGDTSRIVLWSGLVLTALALWINFRK